VAAAAATVRATATTAARGVCDGPSWRRSDHRWWRHLYHDASRERLRRHGPLALLAHLGTGGKPARHCRATGGCSGHRCEHAERRGHRSGRHGEYMSLRTIGFQIMVATNSRRRSSVAAKLPSVVWTAKIWFGLVWGWSSHSGQGCIYSPKRGGAAGVGISPGANSRCKRPSSLCLDSIPIATLRAVTAGWCLAKHEEPREQASCVHYVANDTLVARVVAPAVSTE
jgi:hypothetical protein